MLLYAFLQLTVTLRVMPTWASRSPLCQSVALLHASRVIVCTRSHYHAGRMCTPSNNKLNLKLYNKLDRKTYDQSVYITPKMVLLKVISRGALPLEFQIKKHASF